MSTEMDQNCSKSLAVKIYLPRDALKQLVVNIFLLLFSIFQLKHPKRNMGSCRASSVSTRAETRIDYR